MLFLGIMDYTIVKETVLKYQKVLQFIKLRLFIWQKIMVGNR